eukprot:CAMPEP_0204514408 /NCGR_PEP_ID=MMETSP0661-20131031/2052_1 /ASSEMBLY_ACC=CAM_ASM_000606 /TAXON_ID=109239 /ORGANISM="Alexandrium margalefi, Strain AMGDE01CS-322" /LENGTH=324 /DNA_ID=CAMNT_0051519651 /DNA_START=223 /DNA_END=1193 /DNA_ORIENTATION=+
MKTVAPGAPPPLETVAPGAPPPLETVVPGTAPPPLETVAPSPTGGGPLTFLLSPGGGPAGATFPSGLGSIGLGSLGAVPFSSGDCCSSACCSSALGLLTTPGPPLAGRGRGGIVAGTDLGGGPPLFHWPPLPEAHSESLWLPLLPSGLDSACAPQGGGTDLPSPLPPFRMPFGMGSGGAFSFSGSLLSSAPPIHGADVFASGALLETTEAALERTESSALAASQPSFGPDQGPWAATDALEVVGATPSPVGGALAVQGGGGPLPMDCSLGGGGLRHVSSLLGQSSDRVIFAAAAALEIVALDIVAPLPPAPSLPGVQASALAPG